MAIRAPQKALTVFSGLLPLWVLLGAAAAYRFPGAFAWTAWKILDEPAFKWFFAVTMFAVGTVLEPAHFTALARQPLAILFGLLTQFTVMPGLAFLTSRLGGFGDDVALGFIIVGCAPGAMTSNVLAYLAGGDTAYSVTLTTFASIVSVFLTPLLVLALAGAELGMSAETFWAQLWTIAWTVALPLLLGLLLRIATPSWRGAFQSLGPAVAVVAIVAICCFVIQWTRDELGAATGAVFLGVLLVNALGFALGNLLARAYRFSAPQRITLTIEIGMQNAGIGVVLASSTFSERPGVAVPSALFTIWCILTAAGLISFLKRRRVPTSASRAT